MNRRGRPADFSRSSPAPGYSPVTRTGLLVTRTTMDGSIDFQSDFGELDLSADFKEVFAVKFAQELMPRGAWKSPVTARDNLHTVRRFAKFCRLQAPSVTTVEDLTIAVLNDFHVLVAEGQWREFCRLIRGQAGLPGKSESMVSRRSPKLFGRESSYSSDEIGASRKEVWRLVDALEDRLNGVLRLASSTQEGSLGPVIESLLDGDEQAVSLAYSDYRTKCKASKLTPRSLYSLRRALFLSHYECSLLVVACVMERGWNLSTVLDLMKPEPSALPNNTRRGEYNLVLEKRRRGEKDQFEKVSVPFRDEGKRSDILTRIIFLTSPIRSAVKASSLRDSLFLYRSANATSEAHAMKRLSALSTQGITKLHPSLAGVVSVRRIRRTLNVVEQKKPNQNSQQTHDTKYVLQDRAAREAATDSIIAGLNEARSDALARFQGAFEPSSRTLQPAVAGALTACRNPSESPLQADGGNCKQSFLLCFSCSNAVVRLDYLPRNAALWKCLTELRSAVTPDEWALKWRSVLERLEDLAFNHLSTEQWAGALRAITPEDISFVRLVLLGDLDA